MTPAEVGEARMPVPRFLVAKEYAGAAGVGVFAAEMKKRGVTDRELDMLFKDNPARAIGLPVAEIR